MIKGYVEFGMKIILGLLSTKTLTDASAPQNNESEKVLMMRMFLRLFFLPFFFFFFKILFLSRLYIQRGA